MKKLLVVLALFTSVTMFAQDGRNFKTSGKRYQTTAYGALTSYYSKVNGNGAVFSGAYGGVMINHKLMVGLGAYGMIPLSNGYGINSVTKEANDLRMFYGGLMVEYTFLEEKRVHFTANTLVGAGGVFNGRGNGTSHDEPWDELDGSGIFVLQPSVNVEVSATNWMRVGAGVGYRYVGGAELDGIDSKKMSAPTASVTVKFGLF